MAKYDALHVPVLGARLSGVNFYAVHYDYVRDEAALAALRGAHRDFLRALVGSGLIAAGAYPEASDPGALLIVRADDLAGATTLLDDDPFFTQGLVTRRRVELWTPGIGVFSE